MSTIARSRSTVARSHVMRSLAAGGRPEIGTPSRADWAIVCGESTPSRFEFERVGSGAVSGSAFTCDEGTYPEIDAWPQRYGSDCTLFSAEKPRRVLMSMWRSVVVPAAAVLSLS